MLKYLSVLSVIVVSESLFDETPWELKLSRSTAVPVKTIKRSDSPCKLYSDTQCHAPNSLPSNSIRQANRSATYKNCRSSTTYYRKSCDESNKT